MSCTVGYGTRAIINATNGSVVCLCRAGYIGAQCEELDGWYLPTVAVFHGLHVLVLVAVLVWSAFLLGDKQRRQAFRGSLAGLTFGLVVVSGAARIAWLVLPSGEITPFYVPPTVAYAYFYAALSSLAPVLLLSACAIVMTFWVDLWEGKARRVGTVSNLALRSKILLIGLASITFVLAAVGIFILQPTTNFLLILLPLAANAILFTVYAVLIARFNTEGLSDRFRLKHLTASRLCIGLAVAWCLYTLALLLQITLALLAAAIPPAARNVELISHIFYRLCEPAAAVMVMLLLDPHGRVLRKWCRPHTKREKDTTSTSTSSL